LLKERLQSWQTKAQVQFPKENTAYSAETKKPKDRLFTRELAMKERLRDEAKRAAAQSKKK
jgi:hypothetical protein